MTNKQYLIALGRLGLTPMAQETAQTLGLSLRQLARIASGECPVPEVLARLLECLGSSSKRRKPRGK